MEHLNDEDIVLMALGEPGVATGGDLEAREHVHSCARCASELAAYRNLVELGRSSADDRNEQPAAPPPAVWGRIADELGLGAGHLPADRSREDDGPNQQPDEPADRGRHAADDQRGGPVAAVVPMSGRRRMSRRNWLIAAAIAVLAAAGGIAGGIAIGRNNPAGSVAQGPSTELVPLPTGPSGVQGSATVVRAPDGATLNVDTQHLPLRQGFYQVWLYDQVADKMVPIGTLGGNGQGSFTLSPSIDLRSYNIVDVSAQDLNGDPAHGDSVLRGTLTQ